MQNKKCRRLNLRTECVRWPHLCCLLVNQFEHTRPMRVAVLSGRKDKTDRQTDRHQADALYIFLCEAIQAVVDTVIISYGNLSLSDHYLCDYYWEEISVNSKLLLLLFSPLGKLADRAMYFTFRNFFFFLLGAKLSQYLLDRFSRSFHQM